MHKHFKSHQDIWVNDFTELYKSSLAILVGRLVNFESIVEEMLIRRLSNTVLEAVPIFREPLLVKYIILKRLYRWTQTLKEPNEK